MLASVNELIDTTAALLEPVGDPELVIQLFGAADRLNRESGNPITLPEVTYYDAARDRAKSKMTIARYNELLAQGAAMTLEQGFALARETLMALQESAVARSGSAQTAILKVSYGLTPRELEVLQLVALGKSDREIGDRLFISHGTARTHVRNILGKLDVRSRTAATSIALREGLVDSNETAQVS